MKDIYQEIKNGREVRQNLSSLRQEIKVDSIKKSFCDLIQQDYQIFIDLLDNEDAKTRKNTALLLGDLEAQESLEQLMEAYDKEPQLFVKSSYLTAISHLNYEKCLPQLKNKLELLSSMEVSEDNRKHISEEIRELSLMVIASEGISSHKFSDGKTFFNIVLLCNRNYRELIYDQLKEEEFVDSSNMKILTAGVSLQTNKVLPVAKLRTYTELLFLVKGMKVCPKDPRETARIIAASHLLEFLESCHTTAAPFYFRIEIKSKMELDKKSAFAKKTASYLEEFTERKLINSAGNYEVEIRLIEDKESDLYIMVKLFTLEDHRFEYRKKVTPTSIKPVNAALLVALAKDYMCEDARVLDPFCGVGTMLIERQMQVKANTSYGIDFMEDAIEGAKENTEAAGQIIHYIQKDFFDFTHEYLFDEIFTNMPFAIGRKTEEEISDLYENFFKKAKTHLVPDGRIIMYTHNREYVESMAPFYGYKIIQDFEVNKKEETFLYILEQ